MKKYIKLFFLLCAIFWSFLNTTKAYIDLVSSPIKYEINWAPWTIIKRTVSLYNKSNNIKNIVTWKSDFISKSDWTRVPHFITYRENELTWQELSWWIDIETDSFELWPKEKKIINFSITVPEDATPGWHYWMISLKNINNANNNNWWEIGVIAEYWVLVLINIDWVVIKDADVWNLVIKNSDDMEEKYKDDCFLNIDFSWNDYDNKCFDLSLDNLKASILNIENKSNDDNNDEKKIDKDDEKYYIVEFTIPIENKWNTHVKTKWKITLVDENWDIINWIWKELIINKNWIMIGHRIVDYLLFNQEWWNVLPKDTWLFKVLWKGFPYKTYDKDWNQIIKYWTPDQYYSEKNVWSIKILMPWQMIRERISEKKIEALMEVSYENLDWEDVIFKSAKDFWVNYKEKYIGINPYFIIILIILIISFIIIKFIIWRFSKRCHNCKKKIKRNMKVCPYCWDAQEKTSSNNNKITNNKTTTNSKDKIVKKKKIKVIKNKK